MCWVHRRKANREAALIFVQKILMKALRFLPLLLLLAACQNQSPPQGENAAAAAQKVDSLRQEVMALHDQVMPLMNPMGRMRNALMAQKERAGADSAAFRQAADDLAEAQERMMQWMRQYRSPKEIDGGTEEKLAYLADQQTKMEEVEAFTQQAMRRAERLLRTKDLSAE